MNVRLYNNFTKQPNSFKVPGSSVTYTDVQGEIKGDFSPLAPVIRFQTLNPKAMPQSVYAYIASFSRYYFLSWAFIDGAWEASCTVDALSSFRDSVLASRQFVQRSASEKDGQLVDSNYPTTAAYAHRIAFVTQPDLWGVNFYNGTVVMSCVNSTNWNIGANTYYAMSYTAFRALMYALLNSVNWLNIDTSEISEGLQKALINPAQYITSAVWLPVDSSVFVDGGPSGDITQIIKFGWWEFNLQSNVRILHAPTGQSDSFMRTIRFQLSDHPQADIYGSWVNLSPYTKRTLEFPPFGVVDLDTTDIAQESIITCRVFVQSYTGDATLYVYAGDYQSAADDPRLFMSLTGNVGIPLPVGQIAMNLGNYKNALIAGAAAGVDELANMIKGGE